MIARANIFNIESAEVEGTVTSFDCYDLGVEIEVGTLRVRLSLPVDAFETYDEETKTSLDLPTYGEKVTVKFR